MRAHKHKIDFISNKIVPLCNCQFEPARNYCTIQDFILQSSDQIQQKVDYFDQICSKLKFTKIQKNRMTLQKNISSFIYDLKFLKTQILNSNFSLKTKFMTHFMDFQVDNIFHIESNFHQHIMNDFNKILKSDSMRQCDIKVKQYFNNFKIIQIIQGNRKIKIKEIYKNQQYYFSVLLYKKYGFTQQIGKKSIIDMLQHELGQKIDQMLSIMWGQFQLSGQVESQCLIESFTFDSLLCHKKDIVQNQIISSVIVEENYNGQNLIEFQERDQNDLKKNQILLEVKNILYNQKDQTYLQDAIIQIIDQRVNQNAYNYEELKCTELFQIDIHEQVHYDQQEQSNIGCQIYQVQIQSQSKNNQFQNQFIQQPLIHENQPNYQRLCYNFAHYWWGQLNLVYNKDLQDLQELKNLNDLIDLKNECLTQDFGD
ncbi:hypothetical protein pb186bvf_000594 [Paramecium bursaria]